MSAHHPCTVQKLFHLYQECLFILPDRAPEGRCARRDGVGWPRGPLRAGPPARARPWSECARQRGHVWLPSPCTWPHTWHGSGADEASLPLCTVHSKAAWGLPQATQCRSGLSPLSSCGAYTRVQPDGSPGPRIPRQLRRNSVPSTLWREVRKSTGE